LVAAPQITTLGGNWEAAMPNLPTWQDQISAVIAAPIPFAIALVVFGVVFWRLFEWRYRSVIDKMKELSELARIEVDHWKDAAAQSAGQASEQLELAKKKVGHVEAEALVSGAQESLLRVKSNLAELAKANTSPVYIQLSNLRSGDIKWFSATQPTAP
jgi:hypothetical protein